MRSAEQSRSESTSGALWQNDHVELSDHPTARNQAIAKHDLRPGTTILSDPALAAVLIPDQKGVRCDACFRRSITLKRCSRCTEYWYCGPDCQSQHWRAIHKHMCKEIARFRATIDFQASPAHKRVDAFLLSHLVAEHGHKLSESHEDLPPENFNDPLGTFTSLRPLSMDHEQEIPLVYPFPPANRVSSTVLKSLYNRFGNNNFIVHSHLTPIGHGIFPLASRLFNHSCIPNSIVTYVFHPVRFVVNALTEIKAGEEITVPYLDPALPFRRRQEICRYTYGFECVCSCCSFCKALENIPKPPADPIQYSEIGDLLLKYAFPSLKPTWPHKPLLFSLPAELIVVLHEDFLPKLSMTFSDAAHDGPYTLALRSGLILLALYVVIYPARFPQIGVHCLEMAKTAWNASVRNASGDNEDADLLETARQFLGLGMDSLSIMGFEGDDEDGPLLECMTLYELLKSI